MKHHMFNRLCITVCLIAGMASAAPVLAASTGNNFITCNVCLDIWRISCPAGSRGLVADISDLPFIGNSTSVQMKMVKNGMSQIHDASEDLIPGGRAVLDNGSGQYHLVYRQFGSGDDYTSNVFCRNAGGVLIEPASFVRIDNE